MYFTAPAPILLAAWSVTTPRWQQLKALCDALPDSPRSRYEAFGVVVADVARWKARGK